MTNPKPHNSREHLPEEIVLKIWRARVSRKKISKKYGVSPRTIEDIRYGRRYQSITGGGLCPYFASRQLERELDAYLKANPRPPKTANPKPKPPPPTMYENEPPDNITSFAYDQPFPSEPFEWENI